MSGGTPMTDHTPTDPTTPERGALPVLTPESNDLMLRLFNHEGAGWVTDTVLSALPFIESAALTRGLAGSGDVLALREALEADLHADLGSMRVEQSDYPARLDALIAAVRAETLSGSGAGLFCQFQIGMSDDGDAFPCNGPRDRKRHGFDEHCDHDPRPDCHPFQPATPPTPALTAAREVLLERALRSIAVREPAPAIPGCTCDPDDATDDDGNLVMCDLHEPMLRHLRWETLAALVIDYQAFMRHALAVADAALATTEEATR